MRSWFAIAAFVASCMAAVPALACGDDEGPSRAVQSVGFLLTEANRLEGVASSSDAAASRTSADAKRLAQRASLLRRDAFNTEGIERVELLQSAENLDARAIDLDARAVELRAKSRRARLEAAELRRRAGRPHGVKMARIAL
jgi:hypothetical protein